MVSHDQDCIIAQCTPSGKGALALLRISGEQVRVVAQSFIRLASGKKVTEVSSHTIHYGRILSDTNEIVDQVMVIVMDGPQTFTGQDVIEITCHNNPFLIEAIIMRALQAGVRIAQEGEFSRRAYLNGKIDLLQAEAINELIGAQTQHALKKSLAQLEGSFSQWIHTLEKDVIRAIAWCEASFEFLDEEREFGNNIQQHIQNLLHTISSIRQSFNAQQHIREGIRIALIGSVNAGKSSLFNALLNKKRAIVTPLAGTTRDVIEAGLQYEGNYWTLIDTAGLRQTQDVIEQEGIKRSYDEAHKADIILLIIDSSRAMTEQEKAIYSDLLNTYRTKCMLIYNKIDIAHTESQLSASDLIQYSDADSTNTIPVLEVSTATGHHIDELRTYIEKKSNELLSAYESPYLLNKRQHTLLSQLESKLQAIQSTLHQNNHSEVIHYELISFQLKDALSILSELTGKSIQEASLDMVFKEFCVGK